MFESLKQFPYHPVLIFCVSLFYRHVELWQYRTAHAQPVLPTSKVRLEMVKPRLR